jgi:hypothetical protein
VVNEKDPQTDPYLWALKTAKNEDNTVYVLKRFMKKLQKLGPTRRNL